MHFKTFKASASRQVLALLAVGALLPFSAHAQDGKAAFNPASTWTVGSTELSNVRGLKSMKLPCVITNEFDNGFVIRFSGGGGQLMAMAVDFRQDVFKQGKKYDAMISIGDGYMKQVTATAFTANTLIFSLRPLTDFYGAVKGGEMLEIDIDGNIMKFALGKLGGAFPAMESCYKGEKMPEAKPLVEEADNGNDLPRLASAPDAKVEKAKATNAPAPLLPADIAAKPLPQSFDEIVKGSENEARQLPPQEKNPQQMRVSQVTPKPAITNVPRAADQGVSPDPVVRPQVSRAVDTGLNAAPKTSLPPVVSMQQTATPSIPMTPLPDVQSTAAKPLPLPPVQQPATIAKTWDAKAGEDLKIVLSRWAERAGYDLQWQADQDGKVAQDITLSGSFEDAVSQLLAENSAATGIAGHLQSDSGKKDLTRKDVKEPAAQSAPIKAIIPALHSNWNAPAGANIQGVVDQWATQAGVTVVWQSYMSIPLKSPVTVTGSFEEAVQTLLDQYEDDSARPVGQLNIDPESGQRTLLMDMYDPY